MSAIPDRELVLDVASRMDSRPAFIEKDWYIVRLLDTLGPLGTDEGIRTVFCGGTSLSKAFGLTKRFSEDIDLILCSDEPLDRDARRTFRNTIISHLGSDAAFTIRDDAMPPDRHDRFFSFEVDYDVEFREENLRPHLLLDMTYGEHRLPLETKEIQTIVSEHTGDPPETRIACLSPLETASDKISALAWRVIDRGADPGRGDSRMVRHLHDLAAMKATIQLDQETFVACALESLERDRHRGRGGESIAGMEVPEKLDKAMEMLESQKLWREEYRTFVEEMSFAPKEERLGFDDALTALGDMVRSLR